MKTVTRTFDDGERGGGVERGGGYQKQKQKLFL